MSNLNHCAPWEQCFKVSSVTAMVREKSAAISEFNHAHLYITESLPDRLLGHGGLVVRSRLRGRRVPGSKPDSTKRPAGVRAWRMLKQALVGLASAVASRERCQLKRRLRVALKRDVFKTKFNTGTRLWMEDIDTLDINY
ncbi:hypothetical protein AVEN_116592-1 [Araneus ventricosus]|uniref:Uncharacterized protein n=1 Tax=Araneus ventricosus TaxID=182803 RepID=A0A4Y2DFC4_ARAVE|nr:hypothetical protein AVEN_116592-1 [Araneus ventricosus]